MKRNRRCIANSTVSGYPPIIIIIHRWQITGSSLELHSLSILLDPWVGRGHGHKMLRPQSSTSCSHPLPRQAQAFLSLSRSSFPLAVCVQHIIIRSLSPGFSLSSCGNGPRNLTGTPPLEDPSTTALVVGSIPFAIALPAFLLALLVRSWFLDEAGFGEPRALRRRRRLMFSWYKSVFLMSWVLILASAS